MRKLTLLTSVLLASSFQTVNVSAQCMNTINCQTLGYTKTSCTKGGVKCPTGNYWYCPKDTTTPQCSSSYKYTCTGAYQSPSGTACNGLYTSCTCTSGYQWTNGSCQKKEIAWGSCNGLAQNCSIGNILNSDGTCTYNKESGKTPIGVVVYKSGNCGQAVPLDYDPSNCFWTYSSTHSTSYIFYNNVSSALQDFDSCGKTKVLLEQYNNRYIDSDDYHSIWHILNLSYDGKWCVPALGVLKNIINNLYIINQGLQRAGGRTIDSKYSFWSITEYSTSKTWAATSSNSGVSSKSIGNSLLPVLQF